MDYKNISTTIATRTLETEPSKALDLKTIPMLKAAADATELAAKHAAKAKDLQKSKWLFGRVMLSSSGLACCSDAGSAEEHFLDKKSTQRSKPLVQASSLETDGTKGRREEKDRKKKVAKALSPVESDSEEEATLVLNTADSFGDEKKAAKSPKALAKPEKTVSVAKAPVETKTIKKIVIAAAVESDDDDDLLSAVKKSVKTKKKKASASKKLTS